MQTSVGSGREKSESEWQKHFSFGQAKYIVQVLYICVYAETVKQLIICVKH